MAFYQGTNGRTAVLLPSNPLATIALLSELVETVTLIVENF